MSRFFNYNAANMARLYDRMRKPHGVDVIAGLLHVHCNKPFQNIHLLDAGCGTGQHAEALLKMGIGEITLLDASPEMLTVAEENVGQYAKHKIAHIVEAVIPPFPFDDNSFDAVMFNQSLHHLDDVRDGENFPKLEQALEDAQRVLRPTGVLIISTVLSTTLRESVWFLQLQSDFREKLSKTMLSTDQFMDIFNRHGFQCLTAMNLLTSTDTLIYPTFLDPDSILDGDWRHAINIFDIATDAEINQLISAILGKKENGTLDPFVKDNDHTNNRGLVTIFACISKT